MIKSPRLRRANHFIKSHSHGRVAIIFLLVLLILVAVTLRRTYSGASAAWVTATTSSAPEVSRSCTSEDTQFADVWNVTELETIFAREMSLVFEERLDILKTPSKWECPSSLRESSPPPMPRLQAFADDLPGWSYAYVVPFFGSFTTHTQAKPVNFENFASIISEYRRAYECRIDELQADVDRALLRNLDINATGTQFCCDTHGSCVLAGPLVTCGGSVTSDPECDVACPITLDSSDILRRQEQFLFALEEAKTRARVAIDRTMLTMRSFEINYAYARELMCYARASLDLRNNLNLLAEATSCMPKIWNAVTSLHDRKE